MCDDHPDYKMIYPPKSKCLECWKMYIESKDEPTITKNFYLTLIKTAEDTKTDTINLRSCNNYKGG